jgi:nitroimidazol reductase NimA-like FMN-containing flavoprotein (pyridoxamine 5'-phosphate oxidase superfamily)
VEVHWPSSIASDWHWNEDQEVRSFKVVTAPSTRTRIRRVPNRADYSRETIDAILDEALVAHLGFAIDGQPYVIPTLHARVGDLVYVHGSSASRAIRSLTGGLPACLTVTLLDGLVLARSAFHHSMNYRSAVVLGQARPVEGTEERLAALEAFTERLVPGRWDEVRPPTRQELKGTRVLAFDLDEASAKVRTGPPVDDDEDYELEVWAGVIPLAVSPGQITPDPKLTPGIEPSEAVRSWGR